MGQLQTTQLDLSESSVAHGKVRMGIEGVGGEGNAEFQKSLRKAL